MILGSNHCAMSPKNEFNSQKAEENKPLFEDDSYFTSSIDLTPLSKKPSESSFQQEAHTLILGNPHVFNNFRSELLAFLKDISSKKEDKNEKFLFYAIDAFVALEQRVPPNVLRNIIFSYVGVRTKSGEVEIEPRIKHQSSFFAVPNI